MTPELVFLLSLPRSGSTLLQRILGAYPGVATSSEPHLLLPLLRARSLGGVRASFAHRQTASALEEFLSTLPDGDERFFEAVRAYAASLYRDAAAGAAMFVDKTPKYAMIAPQLLRCFPEARVIYLWRNPLAVLASCLVTWEHDRLRPTRWTHELHVGLAGLCQATRLPHERCCSLRYEELIAHPERELRRMAEHLDLPWHPEALTSFNAVRLSGRFRDPKSDRPEYGRLRHDRIDAWKRVLDNPLRKRWARGYLEWIGRARLELMGYDLDQLRAELEAVPSSSRRLATDLVSLPLSKLTSFLDAVPR